MNQDDFFPEFTFSALLDAYGPVMYNPSARTTLAMAARVGHVFSVWREKYGDPLTPEQEAYGDQVLAAVIGGAVRDAKLDGASVRAYVMHRIGTAIHNERVVAGMRKRGYYVDPSEILKELNA